MTEFDLLNELELNEKDEIKKSLLNSIKIKVEVMDEISGATADNIVCRVREKTQHYLLTKLDNARAVIDEICKTCKIEERGRLIYCLYPDGTSVVAEDIKQYFARGGDKVRLKRENDELRKENDLLKKIIKES